MAITIVTTPSSIRAAINRALSEGIVRIAVAFWGRGSIAELGLDTCAPSSARILCNLSAGGCNPDVIRALIARGVQVRALGSLHAKVYLGATAAVLGSANASTDGLGLLNESSGWNEACVWVDDPNSIAQLMDWFDSLWEQAADLSNPQIAQILLEQADRAPPSLRVDPFDLLTALRANPLAFARKDVFVTLDYEPYSHRVEKKVQELNEQLAVDIDAWEDWEDMPPAAAIVSFHYHRPSNQISLQGIYESPRDPKGAMDPRTKGIFVTRTRRILGTYEVGDLEVWCEAVSRWQKKVFVNGRAKDKDLTLPLADFAATYLATPRKR